METTARAKRPILNLWTLATCLLLLLLLAGACAPTAAGRTPWFGTATIGTATGEAGHTFATNIVVLLGYTGDISNLDITVTGPNDYHRTETLTARRARVSLQEAHGREEDPLASGAYHVQVTGHGGEQTWTLDFDASENLPPPTNVHIQTATTTTVEVTWDLIPQARTYELALWERTGPTTGRSIPPSAELIDPTTGQHTFTNLDLDTNGEYWVSLDAYDGVNRNDPNSPPRQINSTYHWTEAFTPSTPN